MESANISIHALREEGDFTRTGEEVGCAVFLSTPSARRATPDFPLVGFGQLISIHALREEGDAHTPVLIADGKVFPQISIHALREEGDIPSNCSTERLLNFYPRPPRGGRQLKLFITKETNLFLSTPSARRATAKTETKSLFSNKLYNILHEFRRALIYNGSKNYPNHAK